MRAAVNKQPVGAFAPRWTQRGRKQRPLIRFESDSTAFQLKPFAGFALKREKSRNRKVAETFARRASLTRKRATTAQVLRRTRMFLRRRVVPRCFKFLYAVYSQSLTRLHRILVVQQSEPFTTTSRLSTAAFFKRRTTVNKGVAHTGKDPFAAPATSRGA